MDLIEKELLRTIPLDLSVRRTCFDKKKANKIRFLPVGQEKKTDLGLCFHILQDYKFC